MPADVKANPADRANAGLTQYRDRVPAPFDAGRLIEKLTVLDSAWPRFHR